MRTQARAIVLVLVAVTLGSGCGSKTSSDTPKAADPSEIVFTVNRNGWNEIWVMDSSGEDRRRLTEPPPSGSDAAGNTSPAWAPDGKRIAFVGSGEGPVEDQNTHELYVMSSDGGDIRQLTKNEDLDGDPSWSPDGKRIVFVRAEGWGTEHVQMSLRVIDADGSRERVLREEAQADKGGAVFLHSPAWSPDGTKIMLTRSIFGPAEAALAIYVMDSDGLGLKKVADDAAQPAWSPDGKRLAFTGTGEGETCFHDCTPSGDIYVADADGGNVERLTRSQADDTSPAWSPDGTKVVFSSDRSNRQDHELELYVVPATGGEPQRLTRNSVWDIDPDWR